MEGQEAIISFLRDEKILDEEVLQRVLEEQEESGQSLINLLKRDKLLNENQLTKVIATTSGIEFINLAPEMVDPMVAHLVSYELASHHNVIPVKIEGDRLEVAMSNPLNLSVQDQIEMKTGYKVVPVAATPSAIQHAIHYHFNVKNVTKQALVSMRLGGGDRKVDLDAEIEDESLRMTHAPVAKLVSSVINGAIDARASDIHIEPQTSEVRVRYRIDGILHEAIKMPPVVEQEVVSHIKVMADMDISERRVPQDGHMSIFHNDIGYDLRVSSIPGITGEKIVIRILDKNVERWLLDTVVSSKEDNQKFRKLASNPYGMILMTGPTGSGKTTTLYSLLQLLNNPEKNIVTVEDPVEYRLEGITQLQVKPIAGLMFATALRSIVRQDPDIILVGEIRDEETAEIAVNAALTGHMVLTTLHTNDAAGAMSRLVNLGVQPFLVSSALLGAVAQRLVRTICSDCKESYKPSDEELEQVHAICGKDKEVKLYRGEGCSSCYHTGYKGRKAVYEIISVSLAIKKLVLEGASDEAIKQQALKEGMRTLSRSAICEVLDGTTTLEEAMRVVGEEGS